MTVRTHVLTPDGRVELADAVAASLRLTSPQGVIELREGTVDLLPPDLVDDLGDLWGSLLDGLAAIARGEALEIFYPSYPVPITLREVAPRRHVRHVQLSAGGDEFAAKAVVSWPDLFAGVAGGAQAYAEAMQTLDPARAVDYARVEQEARSLRAAGLNAHARRGRP